MAYLLKKAEAKTAKGPGSLEIRVGRVCIYDLLRHQPQ